MSKRWRSGLAEWDITPKRIQELAQAVEFAVYTPGSDVGLPVNILASLAAPELDWDKKQRKHPRENRFACYRDPRIGRLRRHRSGHIPRTYFARQYSNKPGRKGRILI